MLRRLISLVALTMAVSATANETMEVLVAANDVFVPKGFDSNDHTEFVVAGWLPNTCYARPKASVTRDGTNLFVSVTADKTISSNRVCIQMAIPYSTTVHVGKLLEGEYTIHVNSTTSAVKTARLEVATPESVTTDNFVYADVSMVDDIPETDTIVLRGQNPSPCLDLDRIRVEFNGVNTYSVMPIMKQVTHDCPRMMVPFLYHVNLPREDQESKVLVHVRKMDGTAINHLHRAQ